MNYDKTKMPMKKHLELFQFICKTGGLTYTTLAEHFNYKKTAINKFMQLDFIDTIPEPIYIKNGRTKEEKVFVLNRAGRDYAIGRRLTIAPAKYTSLRHQRGLEKELVKLLSDTSLNLELGDIINEKEAAILYAGSIKDAEDKGHKIAVADFTIKTPNGFKAIEVATKNYGKALRKAHKNYAEYVLETKDYSFVKH